MTERSARILAIRAAAVVRKHQASVLQGLQQCRINAGLTQRQAAEAIGCPHATYRNWEEGYNWPSSFWLPLIAEAFRVSIEELYFPVETGPETQ